MAIALVLLLGAIAADNPASPIPDATPVHLSVALRIADAGGLDAFRKGQHDPASPDYQRTLTPKEFGLRFGASEKVYARVCSWLKDAGFAVTEFPNRIFVEGTGTAASVNKLLGVRLQGVEGQPASVHIADGVPHLPAAVAPFILHISGLDTRVRYHHHVAAKPLSGGPHFD